MKSASASSSLCASEGQKKAVGLYPSLHLQLSTIILNAQMDRTIFLCCLFLVVLLTVHSFINLPVFQLKHATIVYFRHILYMLRCDCFEQNSCIAPLFGHKSHSLPIGLSLQTISTTSKKHFCSFCTFCPCQLIPKHLHHTVIPGR